MTKSIEEEEFNMRADDFDDIEFDKIYGYFIELFIIYIDMQREV